MTDYRRLADAAYAALNAGDLDGFLAVVHPQAEFESLIAEAEGQTFHGHAGVREWWTSVVEAFGEMRFVPEEIRTFDHTGVSRVRVSGRVAGVEVPQTMWQAFVFRDGRTLWWATFRTEAEAVRAAEARSGMAPQRSIDDMSP